MNCERLERSTPTRGRCFSQPGWAVVLAVLVLAPACGDSGPAGPDDAADGDAGDAPPPDAANASDPLSLGGVGCSITLNAINGYVARGGDGFWPVDEMGRPASGTGYPGGSLAGWIDDLASGAGRWDTFAALLARYPPRAVWWELCASADSATAAYDEVAAVADKIRELAPGLPVYASASPQFPGDGSLMCNAADSPAVLHGFVDRLVADGLVERGPLLTPLSAVQVAADGCHATAEGEAVWGRNLEEFFGL
ncbi:MAG: hypothetical protein HY906_21250 [Deltaproteobacteria bacterium]|nr:hypothetical protein [Deltaproteobacteria bacterium]